MHKCVPSQFLQDRFPRHLSAVTFGEGPSHLLHLLQDAQATYLHGAVGQGITEVAENAEIGDAVKLGGVKMSAVLVQQQWSLELRLVRVSRLTLRPLAQNRAAMIRVEWMT